MKTYISGYLIFLIPLLWFLLEKSPVIGLLWAAIGIMELVIRRIIKKIKQK